MEILAPDQLPQIRHLPGWRTEPSTHAVEFLCELRGFTHQEVGRRFKGSWEFLESSRAAYSILKPLCFDNLPDQSTMAAITFADYVVSH
jgi:hypothetical protein